MEGMLVDDGYPIVAQFRDTDLRTTTMDNRSTVISPNGEAAPYRPRLQFQQVKNFVECRHSHAPISEWLNQQTGAGQPNVPRRTCYTPTGSLLHRAGLR